MRIALLCPSRGRPDRFKKMLESARAKAAKDFEVLLYQDDDDSSEYPDVKKVVGPRINLGPAYNRLTLETDADLLMMCADDLEFQSQDWDETIRSKATKDLICVVSFDDGSNREDGHPFVGRRLVEILGYIAYPKLGHSCIDNWIVGVGKELGRFFKTRVRIEHQHPKYGSAEWDDTYLENSKAAKDLDGVIYRKERRNIPGVAAEVLEHMK